MRYQQFWNPAFKRMDWYQDLPGIGWHVSVTGPYVIWYLVFMLIYSRKAAKDTQC